MIQYFKRLFRSKQIAKKGIDLAKDPTDEVLIDDTQQLIQLFNDLYNDKVLFPRDREYPFPNHNVIETVNNVNLLIKAITNNSHSLGSYVLQPTVRKTVVQYFTSDRNTYVKRDIYFPLLMLRWSELLDLLDEEKEKKTGIRAHQRRLTVVYIRNINKLLRLLISDIK